MYKHINVGTIYKAPWFKRETQNQLKIFKKNEMMIMREKHMMKKNLEIWEKDQILWKNDDDGTWINKFEG